MSDYEAIGMVDIRGKRNYQCDMRPDDPTYTCEEGHAASCPYKGTVGCPSSQAEMKAATSNLIVTNYAKWCSSKKFGQGWDHIKQVIFDEGDESYGALANAMQVLLNHKEIEKNLDMDFPGNPEAQEFATWRNWSIYAHATAEIQMIAAKAKIAGLSNPKPAWVKHYTHMRHLTRRLAVLRSANVADWIVEEREEGYQFDPIRPARYSEGALLLRVPNIIIISATLRPKTMFMIGLGKQAFDFQEFDSDFDPSRCPIYYVPTMRVDKRAGGDLTMLWVRLDQIAAKRQDRKGIVHTISYQRQTDIKLASRFSGQMIINEKGDAPAEMVEKFRASGPGAILVSPSVGRGYDFRMAECEWQFICKIPFQPPSKIVKAREHDDPEYRSYQAMQSMVQAIGRGMRSKSDRCESFLADDHLRWFLPRYGHLAPKSFHGFFKESYVLPQPAPKLGE